jgi:hypothetical protein
VTRVCGHKGTQASVSQYQSNSRSLETARPVGCASALGRRFLDPNRSLDPWHDGRADIIPFRYMPVLLRGKGISHVGWDTDDLPCCPHLWRISALCIPLRVARSLELGLPWAYTLGVARSLEKGLFSCIPDCPSQVSICASLQFSCRSQSLENSHPEASG